MACQPKRGGFCPPSQKLWRAAFATREGWSWREESNHPPVADSALKPASPAPTNVWLASRSGDGFARLRESYGGQPSLLAKAGAGERNRTSNLRFTKPLLCRLSYASVRTESTLKPHDLASRHNRAHPST